MKTLFLDLGMGAAGDMLTAALLELLPDPDAFVAKLNGTGLPGVRFERKPAEKCGIRGTHIEVTVHGETEAGHHHHDHEHEHEHEHHHHEHHSLRDIEEIIRAQSGLSDKVKADAAAVYARIAAAESRAHGVPVSEVHFHEVGAMDAVADVTAVCALMEAISPDQVIASPVHVGCGHVHCAHGVLPVPAPATAFLLQGVPIYSDGLEGELCTPTGAALLTQFVTTFGDLPPMKVSAIGYGMGHKDFPRANCVRAMLGETQDETDNVIELSCNVDDMTGEAIGFATERLLDAGALDVYTEPIGMKKSRPGTCIRVLCRPADKEALLQGLFRHTTTLGVRQQRLQRYVMARQTEEIETPFGVMHRKTATGYGVTRRKWEYDDLAAAARESGKSLAEIEAILDSKINT